MCQQWDTIMSFRIGMSLDQAAGKVPEKSLVPRFMASIPDHPDVEAGKLPEMYELFSRVSCWSAVREDHDSGMVPENQSPFRFSLLSAVRLDQDDAKVPDTTFQRPPSTTASAQGCPRNKSLRETSEDQLNGTVPSRPLLPKFLCVQQCLNR